MYSLNPNPQDDSSPTPGGITILVHSSVFHTNLKLNSNLQVQAVRISLHHTITICNIYIPPHATPTEHEIEDLILQLPTQFILMGILMHIIPSGEVKNNTRKID